MIVLKKILTISGIVFFVVATIGILVAIYLNTNFFKSTVTLACQPDGTDLDFTLVISKRQNTVQWQGGGTSRERILEYINQSSIQMKWLSDKDEETVFTLNRLTGNFNLSVKGQEGLMYGRCYEASPKF